MASKINELNQRVELIESNVASGFERLERMLESVLTRNERSEIGYRKSQQRFSKSNSLRNQNNRSQLQRISTNISKIKARNDFASINFIKSTEIPAI
ncbi:uncharacterized protein ASCRUDRAFT_74478 [Ascoidea rubescens DSM 1968]|uniref:Uncharacterized protein n=1 Tax=Ascoidea rubescens DSM 1968 TaxID=1344418 RepID=A0A1D2VN93_9ASCO|nr:hypothetical protein ASCRUDRAFT_74478 [Ascoidea rubescens DSM 1968]ODV63082.1 hypothetical protein ASCRUDRAFT_74478 [Ascoidea rubescens DSM 1968]